MIFKNRGIDEIAQKVILKRREEEVWGVSSWAFQHVGVGKQKDLAKKADKGSDWCRPLQKGLINGEMVLRKLEWSVEYVWNFEFEWTILVKSAAKKGSEMYTSNTYTFFASLNFSWKWKQINGACFLWMEMIHREENMMMKERGRW